MKINSLKVSISSDSNDSFQNLPLPSLNKINKKNPPQKIIPLKIPRYLSCVLSSVKRGLLLGSYDQHFVIRLYRVGGHWGGMASRSPFSIRPMTSLFLTPWKGLMPNIRISHMHTPVCRKVTGSRLQLAWVDDRRIEVKVEPLTEHPDIAGRGEAPEVDGLGGHPLNGKFAFRCYKKQTKKQYNSVRFTSFCCSFNKEPHELFTMLKTILPGLFKTNNRQVVTINTNQIR